jgi:glycosyltransferase involved in cell wall biosynthesis
MKNDIVSKFLISRVNANIAVSKSFLSRLNDQVKFNTSKNFNVIYNGIDFEKFYPTNKIFRKELKLKDDDILLGMVGNFNSDGRDQLIVCKTLPSIFGKYPNAHFAFIGGRSEKNPHIFDDCFDYCKEIQILDRVQFVGARSDINDILNSLDIFVYSSNHDTFGIAVIEAMISGTPVIINDLPALLEVTDNGKYVSVFKTKSQEDLEIKLSTMIENKSDMQLKAASAKKWAQRQFSIENYIENLKNLYKSLLIN